MTYSILDKAAGPRCPNCGSPPADWSLWMLPRSRKTKVLWDGNNFRYQTPPAATQWVTVPISLAPAKAGSQHGPYYPRHDDMEQEDNDPVFRWVITHVNKFGLRVLTFAQQGRETYTTKDEAEKALVLLKPSLRAKVLGEYANTLRVKRVECWPEHYDPKRSCF